MDGPLRIVVLSQMDADALRFGGELRRAGYAVQCERVDTGLALRAALASGPCDVIVSEWSLPHFSAPAAIEMVKGLGLDIPLVVVAGTFAEEMAAAAFRAGARDLLIREQLHRLASVVEREIGERRARAARAGQRATAGVMAVALDGIVGIDSGGAIVEFNPAAEKIFQYSREEVIGKAFADLLLAAPFRDACRRDLRHPAVTGDETVIGKRIEISALRKDGNEVPLELTITIDDSGAPAFFAFVRDIRDRIQERKRAEERLRSLEDHLQKAQKMEAMGHFVAGIAHDFNNVLLAILSSSSLLLDEMADSDPRRIEASEIRMAAERAASLTRQLLSFSRMQSLEPRILDLNALVMGVEKMLRRLIGEGIELSSSLGEGLGLIEAPAGQIEQVIVNLVINARDAMPSGGKLRIETATVGESVRSARGLPENAVMLSISDTGVGMNAETRRHLFEPFFTTKPSGKGTGLGLFISHAIVVRNGGSISVESEPGAGTVFKVYLPGVSRPADRPDERGAKTEIEGGTETVLLVEDDDQVRSVVHRVLTQSGYRVLTARNGHQAMEISDALDGDIQLVLTDVIMPGLGGPELVERLRSKRTSVRALYMSGYLDSSRPETGGLAHTANLVEKPFGPADILRKVRDTLDAR